MKFNGIILALSSFFLVKIKAQVIAAAANQAVITWYEDAGCPLAQDHFTKVVVEDTLCQLVPNATVGGYKVTCNAALSGGFLSYCSSGATCDQCDQIVAFNNDICLTNPPQYGSKSVSITCAIGAAQAIPAPSRGNVVVVWHEPAACPKKQVQSVVIAPQNLCNIVPNSLTQGYKVTCNEAGTQGVFSVCADTTCTNCKVNTPFTNNACLANPPEFGAASVEFVCAAPAVANNTVPTAGGTAVITWYSTTNCQVSASASAEHRSIVAVEQGLCQLVPDTTELGYTVTCNADNSGSISYCQDATCSTCNTNQPFNSGECLQNLPALSGSQSATVQCNVSTIPSPGALLQGDVAISWFDSTVCRANSTQSLVVVPSAQCNTVPGQPTTGYKVTCNSASLGGVYETCDSTCATCSTAAPFSNNQCIPNPPEFGASSVVFLCGSNTTTSSGVTEITIGAAMVGLVGAAAVDLS
jgi:hypothetical protein